MKLLSMLRSLCAPFLKLPKATSTNLLQKVRRLLKQVTSRVGKDSGRSCQGSHGGTLHQSCKLMKSLEEGRWRPIERFALEQRDGKCRTIDNGKPGLQNSATSATERIHTCGSTASVLVARRFLELLGVPLADLLGLVASTDDMQGAFRQILVAPSSLCYTVIGAWNPEIQAMRFFQLYGMPFGLKGAVIDFNRTAAALLAICRRWLAQPALTFLRRLQSC